ncbi:MAG: hypothetical protein ACOC28_04380, partial [Alkalispirochaetaceae bacterium]
MRCPHSLRPPALFVPLYIIILLLTPSIPAVAMLPDGGGGAGLDLPEEPDRGPSKSGRARRRFFKAIEKAAEEVEEALRAFNLAVIDEGPLTALGQEVGEVNALTGAARSSVEELERELRNAEGIEPERLEDALRAGVLMSEVSLIGDPVHPSNGALHHLEREFHLPVGDIVFDLSRLHRGDLALGRLFGRAWFAPFETFAFYSRPGTADYDAPALAALEEQLQSAASALSEEARQRYGGVDPGAITAYETDRRALIEAAEVEVNQAIRSSREAVRVAPDGYESRSVDDHGSAAELKSRSEELGQEVEALATLLDIDVATAHALLAAVDRSQRLRDDLGAVMRRADEHARLISLSEERSAEALRRGLPDPLRDLGVGTVGIVDEKGTLLLYRSADGAWGAGEAVALGKQQDRLFLRSDGTILRRAPDGVRYEYDREGRLTGRFDRNGAGYRLNWSRDALSVTDSFGRRIDMRIRDGGRVVAATAPDGTLWRYEYSAAGELRGVKRPDGAVYRYRFRSGPSSRPLLEEIEKPGEAVVTFSYDESGRVLELSDEVGGRQRFEYGDGWMRMVDRRGGEHRYRFSPRGLPIEEVTPAGGVWRRRYDGDGRLLETTDPVGRRELREYDGSGRLIALRTFTGGEITFTYDAEGRMTRQSDGPRGAVELSFDSLCNVTAIRDHQGERSLLLDGRGRPWRIIDPAGEAEEFSYDSRGYVSRIGYADGTRRLLEHDMMGRLTRVVDEEDGETRFSYDELGRQTEIRNADGTVERRRYGLRGELLLRQLPGGERREYRYDAALRLIEERLPDGTIRRYSYDGEGSPLSVRVGGLTLHRYERDLAGRITSAYSGEFGGGQRFTYDPLGRPLTHTDPEGAVTRFAYAAGAQATRIEDPTGALRRFRYDEWGRLLALEDPEGGTTSYEYDSYGRPTLKQDAAGGEVRLIYDQAGTLTERVEHNGGRRRYRYGPRGRLTEQITPTGGVWKYSYTPSGRLEAARSPEGRLRSYQYDQMGRMVRERFSDLLEFSYTYDESGRLASRAVGGSSWGYRFDYAGRLLRMVDPDGVVADYQYDELGRLLERRVGRQGHLEVIERYSYQGEPGSMRVEGPQTFDLTYDRRGNPVLYQDPDGVSRRYEYDEAGRLERVSSPDGVVQEFRRDRVGRLVETRHRDGSVEVWERDSTGRSTSHVHSSGVRIEYRWDRGGRLIGRRVGNSPWTTREYDLEGRLLREGSEVEGFREFRYDRDGLLLEARSAGEGVTYRYDSAGRQVGTTFSSPDLRIATVYNDRGQVTGRTYLPLGISEARRYTDGGRLRAVDFAGRRQLRITYDETGREETRQFGDFGELRSGYDEVGRLESMVLRTRREPRPYGVGYAYTPAGRLAGEIFSDIGCKLYEYEPSGRLGVTRYALFSSEAPDVRLSREPGGAAYRELYRRLRALDPRATPYTIAPIAWSEARRTEPYIYPDPVREIEGSAPLQVESGPTGQIVAIRSPEALSMIEEGPLRRLSALTVEGREGERVSRFYRYTAPDSLFPSVTVKRHLGPRLTNPEARHRYRQDG